MTRARSELAIALAAAAMLVAFLAWYPGVDAPPPAVPAPMSGAIARNAPEPALPEDTLASAEAPVTPATELPPEELASDRAFINEAFPVLSSWSVEEVKPLLSEAALDASSDAELEEVMTTLDTRLGDLQYFDSPQPVDAFAQLGQIVTDGSELQPYTFTAYYEAGAAEVNLVLEKDAEHSSLYSFDIQFPNAQN